MKQEEKKQLYAVAYEKYRKDRKKGCYRLSSADIEYMHADSPAHARNQFCYSHPNRVTHRVVAVGPALGFFVEDNHGEKLIA